MSKTTTPIFKPTITKYLSSLILLQAVAGLAPGQHVAGFNVQTLDGTYTIDTQPQSDTLPLLLTAYNHKDASSKYMWQDTRSVQSFIQALPMRSHCLFLSYSETAKEDAAWMKATLQHHLGALLLSSAQQAQFLGRMHFAVTSVAQTGHWLEQLLAEWTSPRKVITATQQAGTRWNLTTERLDSSYGWLPWPDLLPLSPLKLLPDPCSSPQGGSSEGFIAVALLTAAPSDPQHGNTSCSLAQIVLNAQEAKATAVIMPAAEGHDVTLLECQGAECGWPLSTPATMIGHAAGQSIKEALDASDQSQHQLEVTFQEQQVPGYYAGIDEEGRLIELGWSKWPTLMHLAWQGQWQEYLHNLKANLSKPALTVPVFVNQNLSGPGLDADVALPPLETLRAHDIFELDFQLSCPGTRDKDCPIWDHTVQLFVCCGDPSGEAPACGGPCSPTVWTDPPTDTLLGQNRLPAAKQVQAVEEEEEANDSRAEKRQCGRELGRWITPFRRRIGRWLTDVTPLLPLLTSQQCHFHLQTAPWALTWTPSLTLRFTNHTSFTTPPPPASPQEHDGSIHAANLDTLYREQPFASHSNAVPQDHQQSHQQQMQLQQPSDSAWGQISGFTKATDQKQSFNGYDSQFRQVHMGATAGFEDRGGRLVPNSILPLFVGGPFDADYNKRYKPVKFGVPQDAQRVLLEAVITGHGYDNNQCAEFCPTSHHFTVNGVEHMLNFTEAATPWGCADKVLEGSEPNEHGTWQYGRGGWCDGQEVRPWVVDVSADIKRHPDTNEITYHGHYQGADPQPTGEPGFIMMESNLVVYKLLSSRPS